MSQLDDIPREIPRAVADLRRVIAETPTHQLLADSHASQPLRTIARALAHDARSRDATRGELLVMDLRRIWRELPEARRLEPRAHEELWERLVTACIEEFYLPHGQPR